VGEGRVFKCDILEECTVMLFPWRQEADHNGYGRDANLGTSAGDWAIALTPFLFPAADKYHSIILKQMNYDAAQYKPRSRVINGRISQFSVFREII
jgi:hypothetical protein